MGKGLKRFEVCPGGLEHLENQYHERLRVDGFRVFLDDSDESYLLYRLDREYLRLVINQAFTYSCLEAECMGMEKKGQSFKDLCDFNRKSAVSSLANICQKVDFKTKHCHTPIKLVLVDDDEMRETLRRKYTNHNHQGD